VTASPRVLKYVISSRMPTIKYGSEYGIVQNASIGSEADQKFATLQLSRRMQRGTGGGLTDNAEMGLIPFQVNPVNLSLTTIGCPFFEHGQQFFFDFQTGTSIDNAYLVTGVEHSLKPGSFETTLKLVPTDKFGYMNTLTDTLAKLKTKIGLLKVEEAERENAVPLPKPKYKRRPPKKKVAAPPTQEGISEWDENVFLGRTQQELAGETYQWLGGGYGMGNFLDKYTKGETTSTTAWLPTAYKKVGPCMKDGSHFSNGTDLPEEYRSKHEAAAEQRVLDRNKKADK